MSDVTPQPVEPSGSPVEPSGSSVERLKPLLSKLALIVIGVLIGVAIGAGVFSRSSTTDHAATSHDHAATTAKSHTVWTCSMHPQVRKSEPGPCPLCGMDLIPLTQSDPKDAPPDSRVALSERAQALGKLRTTTVRRNVSASGQLRLLGRVEPNETTLKTITAWTGGRIDRLHVKVTGERVRAGQAIATLYSPEVFAAHQDLLIAKRQVERASQGSEASRSAVAAALDAARERLRLLGVPDDELSRMETQDRPTQALSIHTPFAGTVIERIATEGAYVATGTPLYRVANLSTLWVQLDAYESDLSAIALDDAVHVTAEALPGEDFVGKVAFIDPTVDARTRTARVRVAIDNKEGRLRPGMFAEATVSTGASSATAGDRNSLVIPASAPLFTGRRSIVYVEIPGGDRVRYEPRTVRLGPRLGHVYPVVAGLSEGERVVSRGAFSLDADLQIQGGASMMTAPDDRTAETADVPLPVPASERAKLAPVVTAYLKIQGALAADSLVHSATGAEELIAALARVTLDRPREAATAWVDISNALGQHARHVKMASDLETARAGFEGLSQGVERVLRRFGNPLNAPLHIAFCPMAVGSQGASWVQRGTVIDNAYFGASMRDCGEIQSEIAPNAFLRSEADARTGTSPVSSSGTSTATGHAH